MSLVDLEHADLLSSVLESQIAADYDSKNFGIDEYKDAIDNVSIGQVSFTKF